MSSDEGNDDLSSLAISKFGSTLSHFVAMLKAKRSETAINSEQIDRLTAENGKLMLEKAELERKLKELQSTESATALRIEQQRDESLRQAQEQLNRADAKRAADDETIRDLLTQLAKAKTEEESLKRSLAHAQSVAESNRVANSKVENLQNMANSLSQQNNFLKQELRSANELLGNVQRKHHFIEAREMHRDCERRLFQEKLAYSQSEMQTAVADRLREKCEFEKRRTELELRIATLTKRNEVLQHSVAQKGEAATCTLEAYETLRTMLTEAVEKLKVSESVTNSLRNELRDLKQRTEQLSNQER